MSPAPAFVRAPWHTPQAIYRELLAAPLEEPLTLEEALAYCAFTWGAGDIREPLLRGYISAARQKVEADTGLALLTQSWRLSLETWGGAPGVLPIPSQAQPLQSLVVVSEGPSRAGPRLTPLRWLRSGATLTFPDDAPVAPWVLDVTAGWADPAALRAQAPLLVHAVGVLTAHFATVGRDLAIVGTSIIETPLAYDAAIAPYRLVVLP